MTSSSTPRAGAPVGDLAGTVLADRYRLVRPIAAGGMAQVWEGADQVLARRVAVKILHPHLAQDQSFVRRFQGEAIAAARLAHPSIVSVYDTLADGGVNAIVMELVTGTTLRADIDEHGPLTLPAVLAIGTQVADALGAAHASRLVHRDVKPANILLSSDGRVLVADFGIAKAVEGSDLTSDGTMVGTAKYLAPEQVTGGPVDGRTDLYALGVVLYEALTGTPPFVGGNDTATAMMRLQRDPVPVRQLRPDISSSVEQVVDQAMAREPAHRFASAQAMRAALVAAGADPTKASAAAQAAVERQPEGASPYPTSTAAAAPGGPRVRRGVPDGSGAHLPAVPMSHDHGQDHDHHESYDNEIDDHPAGRRGLRLLIAVVLLGLGLAAIATFTQLSQPATGEVLAVRSFASYDPRGDNEEMNHLLPLISDGDPSSFWRTEHYNDHRDVVAYKGGVGLRAGLDATSIVREMSVTTQVGGWSADVYAHQGSVPGDLSGWGDPIGTLEDVAAGASTIGLEPTDADHLLIWFTYLSPEFTATVSQLEIVGT